MEDKIKQKEIIDRTKNPNPKLCDKFMISKNKFCKFEKHKASIYCNFHISICHLNIDDGEEFVDCPIDPHHTVSVKKLNKHLKICQALKEK
jgi:hypothetical protein